MPADVKRVSRAARRGPSRPSRVLRERLFNRGEIVYVESCRHGILNFASRHNAMHVRLYSTSLMSIPAHVHVGVIALLKNIKAGFDRRWLLDHRRNSRTTARIQAGPRVLHAPKRSSKKINVSAFVQRSIDVTTSTRKAILTSRTLIVIQEKVFQTILQKSRAAYFDIWCKASTLRGEWTATSECRIS